MRHDELVGIALLLRQGAAPLDPLDGIGDCSIQCRPAGAQPEGCNHQTGVAENVLLLDQSLPLFAADQL